MISDFFFQIAGLKKLPRSGWKIKLGLVDSESVAEHSYMMSVMAMVLTDLKNLNSEKVIKMSILHDWAESKIGDFMPDEIGYDKKSELENYAMAEILESLPEQIKTKYETLWNEFLERDTPEARLVHELDKLEMALQAKIYETDVDPERVKPFIISAVEQIKTQYESLWNEFLERDTSEARLVHELDKLEMALQAKIYETDVDPERVKPFIISAVEQIIDSDVKKVLMDILK